MKENYSACKCPVCGSMMIVENDTIDYYEDYDEHTYTELVVGACEECGAEFQWENVYQHSFLGVKNIRKS